MRHLKFMLVALAITLSSTTYAHNKKFVNPSSVSTEIEKTLEDFKCDVQGDFSVTVFFSVSEESKIQSLSVASANDEINELLQEKLAGQEVPGEFWRKGKIYELTVIPQEKE
ncbi:MAG: hypothetical protein WBL21_08030 [Salinimicrobium sp.]